MAWKSGRVVECTGLENRRGLITFVGSNPTSSAKTALKTPNADRSGSLSFRGFEDTPPFRHPSRSPPKCGKKCGKNRRPRHIESRAFLHPSIRTTGRSAQKRSGAEWECHYDHASPPNQKPSESLCLSEGVFHCGMLFGGELPDGIKAFLHSSRDTYRIRVEGHCHTPDQNIPLLLPCFALRPIH